MKTLKSHIKGAFKWFVNPANRANASIIGGAVVALLFVLWIL